MENLVNVGVNVLVLKDGKMLLGKRKGSHGAGEYGLPGGHLEYLESFTDCAIRETKEECGISIKNIKFLFLANVVKYKPKHYVHIGLIAEWEDGTPEILEPDKAESWIWYDLNDLPSPMFEMSRLSVESYKNKKIYYDKD